MIKNIYKKNGFKLVLHKNHLNYVEDNILECFFKKYNKLLVFLKINFFDNTITMENLRYEEENISKDISSLFRLRKN